ncbi:MAG: putative deacylase [Arenicella sp.]|jgi:predicted deacylase
MKIAGKTIRKNGLTRIEIPIARLPSNTPIDVVAHCYRSANDGPTFLVLGGVHGDEVNGIEIVKRAEQQKMYADLKCGTVISIPLLNVYGFINFERGLPDGKDVNRSFPGRKNGSLASRVAKTLTEHILPHVDFAIDFHTGGSAIYNYPQSRVFRDDKDSIELAHMFGMPHLIKGGLISKSLRKTAHNMKIPMIVFEGGESLRMDEFSITEGVKGIERVLIAKGMKDGRLSDVREVVLTSNSWVRAPRSGMLKCLKISGDYIMKGEILGTISGPYGRFEIKVKATKTGMIYGHNNRPVVSQGDALFHIGYE